MKNSRKASERRAASNVVRFPGVKTLRSAPHPPPRIEINVNSIYLDGVPKSNLIIANALPGIEEY